MTISRSPLCPHIETHGPGWDTWLASLPVRPAWLKGLTTDHCRTAKRIDPAIKTVARRWAGVQSWDEAGGRQWVRDYGDISGCDVLEGQNECTSFDDPEQVKRANDFHVGVVRECADRRVQSCILNIAVGNPREDMVRLLAPCVQEAANHGHYIGYHGYGAALILDSEEFFANRGPLKLEPLLRQAGVVGRIKWLYTEGGFDGVNNGGLGPSFAMIAAEPTSEGAEREAQIQERLANTQQMFRKFGPEGIPSGSWRGILGRALPSGQVIDQAFIESQYEAYARRLVQLGIEAAFLYTFWGTRQWEFFDHAQDSGNVPGSTQRMMAWYQTHLVQFATPPPPPPPPPPSPPYQVGDIVYVTTGAGTNLNLRSGPASTAEVRGKLGRGFKLTVIGYTPGWVNVLVLYQQRGADVLGECYGYVSEAWISKTPPAREVRGLAALGRDDLDDLLDDDFVPDDVPDDVPNEKGTQVLGLRAQGLDTESDTEEETPPRDCG